jgi:hypothetical protein
MGSSWGYSWAKAWGNAWGKFADTAAPPAFAHVPRRGALFARAHVEVLRAACAEKEAEHASARAVLVALAAARGHERELAGAAAVDVRLAMARAEAPVERAAAAASAPLDWRRIAELDDEAMAAGLFG